MKNYYHGDQKEIYFVSSSHDEQLRTYEVGIGLVHQIEEHSSAGEGDKWFYDVIHVTGQVYRIFNPLEVHFRFKNPRS